jgi:two-component system, OmpR family, response regulator
VKPSLPLFSQPDGGGAAVKVLHIENDASVARSIARLMRLRGYEVFGAATGNEAMRHVEVHGLHPDLILTDFHFPDGLTGDQIVAQIAARLQYKPPTIMLSGSADQHEKADSIVDRLLAKPVDADVLLREIEYLLGARR